MSFDFTTKIQPNTMVAFLQWINLAILLMVFFFFFYFVYFMVIKLPRLLKEQNKTLKTIEEILKKIEHDKSL